MPRTSVSAPSFDEFNEVQTYESKDTSLEGTTLAQRLIFDSAWTNIFGLSLILSLVIAVAAVYAVLRIRQIRRMEHIYYASQQPSDATQRIFGTEEHISGSAVHNTRWKNVLEHAHSQSPNDWRQAILEADVMLDDAVTQRGYIGDGLGEKMKQIQRSDITSIDDAWEAHKVRNRVAHEGSDMELSQRETKRVIALFERSLRELGYL